MTRLYSHLLNGGDNWTTAATIAAVAAAAYASALLHPSPFLIPWWSVVPLMMFAGLLLAGAAWFVPNRPLTLLPLRIAMLAAAIAWGFVFPINAYHVL